MKILILNAHPYSKSFSKQIADRYLAGAKDSGHEVELVNIYDLKFNPNLSCGYHEVSPLEDDLLKQQDLIKWCDHLVLVTPIWWGGLPALAKGYVDRVLLPGFAYKYTAKGLEKHFKGKSARVIYTQGASRIASDVFLLSSAWRIIKLGILSFCGFWPVKRTVLANMSTVSEAKKEEFLDKIYHLGKRAA